MGIQGNWYNTYNIEITNPVPEDERGCCDKCVDSFENCVQKCAKCFLKIAKFFTLLIRCIIDPCQACLVGGLILFAHCLHVVYESCIYPFCVCMRVTLDAFNICIEPLWIIMYRAVTPMAKLYGSFRVCEAKIEK